VLAVPFAAHPVAHDLHLKEGTRESAQSELALLDFAFSPLTLPDVREAIKVRCVTRTFKRHDVIDHTQKDLAKGVFVLLDGVVQGQPALSDTSTSLADAEQIPAAAAAAAVGADVPLQRGAVFSNMASVKKVKAITSEEKKSVYSPKGVGVDTHGDGVRVTSISVATETASALWIPEDLFEFAHDPHSLKDVGVAGGEVEASSSEEDDDEEEDGGGEDRGGGSSALQEANAHGLAQVNKRLDAQQQTLDELKQLLLALQPAGQPRPRFAKQDQVLEASEEAVLAAARKAAPRAAPRAALKAAPKASPKPAGGAPDDGATVTAAWTAVTADRQDAIRRMLDESGTDSDDGGGS